MENLKCRNFLGALSMGTAHLMFTNPVMGRPGPGRSPDPPQKVKLGTSGLETTLLGFGTGVKASMDMLILGFESTGQVDDYLERMENTLKELS